MAEPGWPRALVATGRWRASYADPIRLRAGDPLTLSGREEIWDGHRWLWAEAADGRVGWVPDALVDALIDEARARADYSAMELSCTPGTSVTGLAATHGWIWCRDRDGAEGWLPARLLAAA
ncbi:MAG: hypothetical protein CSA74_12075 [Rhodobacterales bacterium]|nr:MAG: hypothetical protein CSA74_12075 [Rhodobacterales bacterium]